ncbi:MAG: hypothetical protein QOF60_3099 [Actinomycetota bacterium]|nr:hypothetical protein [Actinomycetota bacterium]
MEGEPPLSGDARRLRFDADMSFALAGGADYHDAEAVVGRPVSLVADDSRTSGAAGEVEGHWADDTDTLIGLVGHLESALISEELEIAGELEGELRNLVVRRRTLGFWLLTFLATREHQASRYMSAAFCEDYARAHGLLPTGILVGHFRDRDEWVSSRAWLAMNHLLDEPGELDMAMSELDVLTFAAGEEGLYVEAEAPDGLVSSQNCLGEVGELWSVSGAERPEGGERCLGKRGEFGLPSD